MTALHYISVSCLVALLALAGCSAGSGSPLQSLEAPAAVQPALDIDLISAHSHETGKSASAIGCTCYYDKDGHLYRSRTCPYHAGETYK